MKILITGCAGFIGHNLTKNLLESKHKIIGIDNLNKYYSIKLKKLRLKNIKKEKNKKLFKFFKTDINNTKKLKSLYKRYRFDIVIHLAGQPGVRYSIENPESYISANLNGFFNILNISTKFKVKHFIFASTSSVYGEQKKFPFNEKMNTDNPLSLYAATKKSNEVIAYSYSNIYKIPITGLRFFTVYGPFGRPDMSLFSFVKNIYEKNPIKIFNKGSHVRDFTYIDDCSNFIKKIINKKPKGKIPYQILNVGNGKPVKLMKYINSIEQSLNKKSKRKYINLQKGDIKKTHANIKKIQKITKYFPKTTITLGIKKFVNWYRKNNLNKNL